MIPVFQNEIKAGISDLIRSDAGIQMFAKASLANAEQVNIPALQKSISCISDYNDFDLYPLESVLASTGWNKNDDVFVASELWAARSTPINKKINFMHDETDIIGHMVFSYVEDRHHQRWPMDSETWPTEFDLLVGGVLYKVWDSPELQERMDNLIKEIGEDKWFVSMECLFPNFDYAIVRPDGAHALIIRNEDTSFLSKHLRRYGGTGEYEGHKVGRALRNLTFNGKGIVSNPAGERSIILNKQESKCFVEALASLDSISTTENKEMSDVTLEQLNSAKAETAALKYELKTLREQIKTSTEAAVASEIKQYKDKISQAEADLAASKEVSKAHEDNVKALNDKITALTTEKDSVVAELKKAKTEQTKAKRLALFADIEVAADKAQALVDKFIESTDEMFAEIVSAMPKKTVANATAKPNVEAALANATVEPAVNTVTETDTTKDTRAKASAWFSSILTTTNKNTENK